MKTQFRNENKKLLKSIIEENPVRRYINETIIINGIKYTVTNINIEINCDTEIKRTITVKEIDKVFIR